MLLLSEKPTMGPNLRPRLYGSIKTSSERTVSIPAAAADALAFLNAASGGGPGVLLLSENPTMGPKRRPRLYGSIGNSSEPK